MAGNVGPVALENGAASGVPFALPSDVHSCEPEAEFEAADSAEERTDIHETVASVESPLWLTVI